MKRVGVLISGRGSNLQALIAAAAAGRLGGEIALVLSNVAGAGGLDRARAAGIPAEVSEHRGRSREAHEQAVLAALTARGIDLVCLAGYMRVLSPGFVRAFAGRILNVHPSLLPAFPGTDAARQAFEHGVRVAGATVHLVDETLDGGPIVMQEALHVHPRDTPETLAARILRLEHRIYPVAVRHVLEGRVRVMGRRAVLEETA